MNSGDIVDMMRARIAMAGQPLMMPTETCAVIVNHIDELREYLYLTAHTLQDSMDNTFLDSHSDNWINFCKEVIAHAKKLSKDN